MLNGQLNTQRNDAESRVASYLIAQVKVDDDSWIPDYAAKVHDIVHRHGGRYLSRSGNITTLEGDAPDLSLIALIELPTADDLQAFVSDPEYAPCAAARQAGTRSNFVAIDATDIAGTIPYLEAGSQAPAGRGCPRSRNEDIPRGLHAVVAPAEILVVAAIIAAPVFDGIRVRDDGASARAASIPDMSEQPGRDSHTSGVPGGKLIALRCRLRNRKAAGGVEKET
jgi:uncharacterized protein (DUF1330 family)